MIEKNKDLDSYYSGPAKYEIRLRCHLQDHWIKSFENMDLKRADDGTTILTGNLPDQSTLHSILTRIRDLNIELISVQQLETKKNNG